MKDVRDQVSRKARRHAVNLHAIFRLLREHLDWRGAYGDGAASLSRRQPSCSRWAHLAVCQPDCTTVQTSGRDHARAGTALALSEASYFCATMGELR